MKLKQLITGGALAAKKLLLAMALMPLMALADTETVDGIAWTYIVSGGKATVGTGDWDVPAISLETSGGISIPSSLGGFPVDSIHSAAFRGCGGLTCVGMPFGVTSIRWCAFSNCQGLTTVTIPPSVTSIGWGAFRGCRGLTSVEIPQGVTSIEAETFCGCSGLTSVVIPPCVTSIWAYAFEDCSRLKWAVVPPSVTTIAHGAFWHCVSLSTVYVCEGDAERVRRLLEDSGCDMTGIDLVEIDMSDPDIPGEVIDPVPTAADVAPVRADEVTATLGYNGYLVLGGEVTGLVSVKVAKKGRVTASVQLPNGSDSRGLKKFSYTGMLDEDGYAELTCKKNGGRLFFAVGAKAISGTVAQGGVTYGLTGRLATKDILGSVDSLNGKVWSVVLHTPSDGLAHPLLNGYSYLTVTAGKKGKVKIAGMLADGTKVSVSAQGTVFGSSVIVPVNAALYRGKAGGFSMKLKISGDALKVGNVSDWTAVIDGKAVTAKWDVAYVSKKSELLACAAFRLNADNVPLDDFLPTSMNGTSTLPENLSFEATGGKWKLPKAGKVVLTKDKSDLDVSKFGKNPSGLKLSYTAKTGTFKGSFALYREINPGKLKKVTVDVNGTVVNGTGYGSAVIKGIGTMPVTIVSAATEFAYELVDGNAVITDYLGLDADVLFPATVDGHPVLEIAEAAFYYGFSFSTYPFVNIVISEGIQKTGCAAFGYSTELETFLIPSSLTTFGDSDGFEFVACPKLRRVDVADGNANYKSVDGVLYDKSGTTLVYCPASKAPGETFIVPETVTRIAENAFDCSGFKSVILPETLTEIEDNVFSCADGLVSMDIPSSVTNIGRWAFEYCYALESVTIPPSVTSIGKGAFTGCRALKTVYVSPGDAERVAALYPFVSEVEFVEISAPASPQQ